MARKVKRCEMCARPIGRQIAQITRKFITDKVLGHELEDMFMFHGCLCDSCWAAAIHTKALSEPVMKEILGSMFPFGDLLSKEPGPIVGVVIMP